MARFLCGRRWADDSQHPVACAPERAQAADKCAKPVQNHSDHGGACMLPHGIFHGEDVCQDLCADLQ